MADYDYEKAKARIEMEAAHGLKEASLGVAGDWFWTAETVWADGKFLKDLDAPGLTIAGISGSEWATPTLLLTHLDGSETKVPCYTGDVGGGRHPFGLSVMSGPAEEALAAIPCDD